MRCPEHTGPECGRVRDRTGQLGGLESHGIPQPHTEREYQLSVAECTETSLVWPFDFKDQETVVKIRSAYIDMKPINNAAQ